MTKSPHASHAPRSLPRRRVAAARRRLAGTVAAEVGLLALLVWSASRPPFAVPGGMGALPHQIAVAPPLDGLALAAHRIALVLAAWLTLVTLVHLLVARTPRPRALAVSVRLTPIVVRRLVAAAMITAGTVATAVPGAPAGAEPRSGTGSERNRGGPVVVSVRDGRADPGTNAAAAAAPVTPATPAGLHLGNGAVADAVSGSSAGSVSSSVTVSTGDSLWTLTRDALARESGRDPATIGNDEIAPRWGHVCDANRDRLRSGDVNVLAPGEEVVIPPG
jgi:hypothetical protein